jgi:ParB family chromosome partitioning protein
MSDKKRGLGRGLEALLGEAKPRLEPGTPAAREQLLQIPVDLLSRGKYQPRVDMREESLADLADSIKAQGIIQPIGSPTAGS